MYFWKPADKERISAIPIIPIEPAKAVRIVRPFLEIRLLKEQYAQESQRLENKIVQLTEENQELRNEVYKLNNYLVKLGITI